jgi:hypothetical protein
VNSHITDEELIALQASDLKRDSAFAIQGVSGSMFSVARYSMGMRWNGYFYSYIPPTDELIREDVVKWLGKHRKDRAREQRNANAEKQKELP